MATLLNDDEKRWCVYGIILNHVLIPAVRPYLENNILNEYDGLKQSHNIHVQKIHNFPSPKYSHDLHYKNINNNETKDKKKFNYEVKSHVDFGKLFLQNHMAKFNFYNSCDASAVLNLLERIPIFSNLVQNAAKIVRENRIFWSHCNFKEWNKTDFQKKIDNMKKLMKKLSLETEEKFMDGIYNWKDRALTLRTNDHASREELKEHINSLLNKITKIKRSVDEVEDKLKEINEKVDELEDKQKEINEKVDELEDKQKEINEKVDELEDKQKEINEKVDELEDKQKEINEKVDELEDKQKETNEKVDELQNKQKETNEKVDENEKKQNEPNDIFQHYLHLTIEQLQLMIKLKSFAATNQPLNEQNDIQYKLIQELLKQLQGSTAINQLHPRTKHESQLQEWKYLGESTKHKNLLLKLCVHKDEIKLLGDVRVIFSNEFCIGEGSNGTRVYLGLRKDGYGKAVKRIIRDNSITYAHQEKKILNQSNVKKSKYIVNYSYFPEDTGTDFVYLILDLCEESLQSFVKFTESDDLQKVLPKILREILQGLADLHSGESPILHRDLKPSNILRDSNSNFMLADFGISRILEPGAKTFTSLANVGTEYWIAPESYNEDEESVDKARYKKESDVYNAGMVAYYVATKGRHPFGTRGFRLRNMLIGNPVGLDEIKDEALKDLLSWMLKRQPEDRPSAYKALKHPFLMSDDEKFDLLCKVGNLEPIDGNDPNSNAVQQLNSDSSVWKSQMDDDVYNYFTTNVTNGKILHYGSSWTKCLRLIRYVGQHWYNLTWSRPQPEPFYKIGDHKNYFLKTFPNLPVRVHAAVRSDDELKNNPELKNIFNFNPS
ncbi:probable serine/threonine-protein kinase ireA isoform X1 [Xenia sp. Carnegie-2017]|uniref:probable serine/threonine-protein kinase ireA isoform X1 n=1 Tax=Xenia sp. Carnegie-2017 TaxID=2897299 RepID=UPI001F03EAFA|nr:probable serine/threonine-protein kinase ireA isoform X1 [Xenia sp. Carnegie-2017]XP_046854692.1 probable serine/threonine-protein kinase ireA isoform X1 [Xenia sp. Carnegie-2017]XP_046854693.1 probable serine/threonine-protein kinase ireA isoform X1 [Xenia sp. Carnegie-2017]